MDHVEVPDARKVQVEDRRSRDQAAIGRKPDRSDPVALHANRRAELVGRFGQALEVLGVERGRHVHVRREHARDTAELSGVRADDDEADLVAPQRYYDR